MSDLLISADDPRWPTAVVLVRLVKDQLARIERLFGDDADPLFQLELVERRADVAALVALVETLDPPEEGNSPCP